jgi:DNA repair exonuclease SbcCD ATPase subunit
LEIDSYQLYPGNRANSSKFSVDFSDGPWVILGVNGLGKSTLLLIIRYLLAGPFLVRAAGFAGFRADRDTNDVLRADKALFAIRTSDRAKNAEAEITVSFGRRKLRVRRHLSNLRLITYEGGGARSCEEADEQSYRAALCGLMGVDDFANALRVIDRLIFHMEPREWLLWSEQSQYELMRALMFPPDDAAKLRKLEGAIISADSAARNMASQITKLKQKTKDELAAHAGMTELKARMAEVNGETEALKEQEAQIEAQLKKLAPLRIEARTQVQKLQQQVDSAASNYEEKKFELLQDAFSSAPTTLQYIFLKASTENVCSVCGSADSNLAAEIHKKIHDKKCILCASAISRAGKADGEKKLQRNALEAAEKFHTRTQQLQSALLELERISAEYQEATSAIQNARERLYELEELAAELQRQLPTEDLNTLRKAESRIKGLQSIVDDHISDREKAENKIEVLIASLRGAVEKKVQKITDVFEELAEPFFAEKVQLVYEPRDEKIGEGGREFSFPAFQIGMTSGTTGDEFARRDGDSVSLSQKEYLDLIFRMAIIRVVSDGSGTMFIDGPEGSLDAIFAGRAGHLLGQYSDPKRTENSGLLVACNVIEGAFLPSYFAKFPSRKSKESRTVNLLEYGNPTAALKKLKREYSAALNKIYKQVPAKYAK